MRGHALDLETPLLPFTGSTDSTRLASEMAAERAGLRAATTRGRVYACIQIGFFYGAGATDKEVCRKTGLDGNTVRPRRIELWRAGLIEDTGVKRDGCTVWGAR